MSTDDDVIHADERRPVNTMEQTRATPDTLLQYPRNNYDNVQDSTRLSSYVCVCIASAFLPEWHL